MDQKMSKQKYYRNLLTYISGLDKTYKSDKGD